MRYETESARLSRTPAVADRYKENNVYKSATAYAIRVTRTVHWHLKYASSIVFTINQRAMPRQNVTRKETAPLPGWGKGGKGGGGVVRKRRRWLGRFVLCPMV